MSVQVDLGRLCVFDYFPLDIEEMRKGLDEYFFKATLDKTNLILNELGNIKEKRKDDSDNVIVSLPKPITQLPREKPVYFVILYCYIFAFFFS
jgi:hypothetical protein